MESPLQRMLGWVSKEYLVINKLVSVQLVLIRVDQYQTPRANEWTGSALFLPLPLSSCILTFPTLLMKRERCSFVIRWWVGWSKPIVSTIEWHSYKWTGYVVVYLCTMTTVSTPWQIYVCINHIEAFTCYWREATPFRLDSGWTDGDHKKLNGYSISLPC